MNLLDEMAPAVEKASVDEAYLDISGMENIYTSPEQIGTSIRKRVFAATGLSASVGIGPNRLIAKLGSEACKPDGLKIVRQEEVLDFLAPMPIGNLRGMGKQTLRKVARLNISNVGELRNTSQATLESHVGKKAAANFIRQAHGIASSKITVDRQRKSISKETTFSQDVADKERLHDVLRDLARQVARTARHEQLAGRVITLKVRYAGFETFTRRTSLDQATDDERLILETASILFINGTLPDKPVRLIGVGISGWAAAEREQVDLFAKTDSSRTDQRILETIDKLTDKYGKPILQIGVSRQKS
jgi:DNA polymerase-4